MDLATLIGFAAGLAAVIVSILLSGTIGAFIDYPSLVIVFGGAFSATLVNYPLSDVISVMGVVKNAFFEKVTQPPDIINNLVTYAETARREGILALEQAAEGMTDVFMRKGVQLAVDGTAPDLIRNILETELAYLEDRHKLGQNMVEMMSVYTPAFGMIGTLIGLINMLKTLDDPTKIGAGMAVALITTFYGAVSANLFLIPLVGKLRNRTTRESLVKELIIEGIMSIQAGDNPRVVEEKLKAFLAPKLRAEIQRKK